MAKGLVPNVISYNDGQALEVLTVMQKGLLGILGDFLRNPHQILRGSLGIPLKCLGIP